MSTKSEQRAKNISATIASIRNQSEKYQSSFDIADLISDLKTMGCPYISYVPRILKESGKIIKNGDYYIFSSSEPVHYKIIKLHLDHIISKMLSDRKCKHDDAYQDEPAEKEVPAKIRKMTMDEMIAELKSAGYKVYAPITDYVEI